MQAVHSPSLNWHHLFVGDVWVYVQCADKDITLAHISSALKMSKIYIQVFNYILLFQV